MGALQDMGFGDIEFLHRCPMHCRKEHCNSLLMEGCPVAAYFGCLFRQVSFLCLFHCLPGRLIFFVKIQVFSCGMPNCCAKFGSFL